MAVKTNLVNPRGSSFLEWRMRDGSLVPWHQRSLTWVTDVGGGPEAYTSAKQQAVDLTPNPHSLPLRRVHAYLASYDKALVALDFFKVSSNDNDGYTQPKALMREVSGLYSLLFYLKSDGTWAQKGQTIGRESDGVTLRQGKISLPHTDIFVWRDTGTDPMLTYADDVGAVNSNTWYSRPPGTVKFLGATEATWYDHVTASKQWKGSLHYRFRADTWRYFAYDSTNKVTVKNDFEKTRVFAEPY